MEDAIEYIQYLVELISKIKNVKINIIDAERSIRKRKYANGISKLY